MKLFSKKTSGRAALPRAVAFVDYEHWYVSLLRNFGLKPDIGEWFALLSDSVNLTDVFFFADFSHKSLADEIRRIRLYSNKIIDTRNANGTTAKDYTDFIILDNMYQRAISAEDTDVFILFTGDGHFSSVCSFIRNIRGKEMWVYGVRNSFSRQLQETATRSVILPTAAQLQQRYRNLVLDRLAWCETQPGRYPTVKRTIEEISVNHRIKPDDVRDTINSLIKDGYLTERSIVMRGSERRAVLFVDWGLLSSDGIYEKPADNITRGMNIRREADKR